MSTFFKIAFVFLISNLTLQSQNNTIEHLIVKGENVYRISLKYNVTINAIYELNPEAKDVIRAGETLLIPKKNSTIPRNSSLNYENYLVSKGETKYGISKAYGISIAKLEELNPFIKNGLQAGHNLKIPSGTAANEVLTNERHVVKKGETLWRISQYYNISLAELRALNNNTLNGNLIKIGQVLIVSSNKNSKPQNTYTVKKGDTKYSLSKQFNISILELERLNPEIKDVLKTGAVLSFEDLSDSTKNTDSKDTASVEDNKEQTNSTNLANGLHVIKPKETLYGLSKRFNVSQDDLIRLNPKLKTKVIVGDTIRYIKKDVSIIQDTEADTKTPSALSVTTNVLWIKPSNNDSITNKNANDYLKGIKHAVASAKTKFPNAIIDFRELHQTDSVPNKNVNSKNITIKPKQNSTSNSSKSELDNYTITYSDGNSTTLQINAFPSKEEKQNKMISHIKSLNGHVICLYDKLHSVNTEVLKDSIPELDLIKLNRNGSFKTKDLIQSLDANKVNYIVIESSKTGVFLNTTSLLLRESGKYKIQLAVLNPDNIPDSTQISYNRFKILNLMYPMPYNPNYLKETSEDYRVSYMVTSDILNRINTYGLDAFKDGISTSFLGTTFKYYTTNNNIVNVSVSIFKFDDESEASLLATY